MKTWWLWVFALLSGFVEARNPFLSQDFLTKQELAAKGDPIYQYWLAERLYLGDGIAANQQQAVTWLTKSAEQNYAKAQLALALLYLDGDNDIPAQIDLAVKWFEQAGENDNQAAQIFLLNLYKEGALVPHNDTKMVYWAEKAALLDNATAQYELGQFYQAGIVKKQDWQMAAKFYQKAAQQKHANATANLGTLYFQGLGVKQDKITGYAYWLLAQSLGSESAKNNLSYIEKQHKLNDKEKKQAIEKAKKMGMK